MKVQDIYQLINFISNKNKAGNAFTINFFNSFLEISYKDFFKKKLKDRGALLDEFVVNEIITVGNPMTYDYAYWKTGTVTAPAGSLYERLEYISEDEYSDRLGDSILAPAATSPVIFERAGVIVIKPDTITEVDITYFRYPLKPFCDYYIAATTGIKVFLDAAEVRIWATGDIDSAGTTHNLGDPNWTSLTQELEFNEDLHEEYMLTILSIAGMKLDKIQLAQYAEEIQKKK